MKSEDEIQRELAYWNGVVAAFRRDLSQGRKLSEDEFHKVTEARFRIQDLIWVLGQGKGGKASRKWSVHTEVLLELFGGVDPGDGRSLEEMYYASKDRNSRYGIRKKLLKEAQSGRYTSWEIF